MTDSASWQPEFTPETLEAGRLLFAGPSEFVKGVVALEGLPVSDLVEVAFAGRSNVGKSSLLNALTGRKTLARTSNTPGRTRELNFFTLGVSHLLVDMPGYGYARAERAKSEAWNRLVRDYLRGRANLRRLFMLIDSRHGIKPNDVEIMDLLDEAAVSYQIVLTKCDKPRQNEFEDAVATTIAALKRHPAAHPIVHTTSSAKSTGVAELRAEICSLAGH